MVGWADVCLLVGHPEKDMARLLMVFLPRIYESSHEETPDGPTVRHNAQNQRPVLKAVKEKGKGIKAD